jgi:uncharacterized membrane protein
MEIERLQVMIGKIMLIGAIVSATITAIGAIIFLIQHGYEPTHFHLFNPTYSHVKNYFSGRGLIEIGLYIIVFTQILRVAFTGWIFVKMRDKWFTVFTVFVFLVLIYSLFV